MEAGAQALHGRRRGLISYRRDVQPDAALADALHDQLVAAGHHVFMDVHSIRAGAHFAEIIEQEIQNCDYVIVLLSSESVTSDWVKQEVKVAYMSRQQRHKPLIIPVRVDFDDRLDFEFGAYLGSMHLLSWHNDCDTPELLRQIILAVDDGLDSSATGQSVRPANVGRSPRQILALLLSLSPTFIATVAAMCGAVALVVGYSNRQGEAATVAGIIGRHLYELIFTYRYEIVIGALATIFMMMVLRNRLRSHRFLKIISFCDDFFDCYINWRDKIVPKLRSLPEGAPIDPALRYVLLDETDSFLRNAVNILQYILTTHTRSHCHVAIKTFNKSNGMVTTHVRDDASPERKNRDQYQRSVPYKKDTAFRYILDDDRCSFFCCNHLTLRSIARKFETSHEDWFKYYKSVIIVPISLNRDERSINKETVWGFICADNKRGGFDGRECRRLLVTFARAFSSVFQNVGRIHQERAGELDLQASSDRGEAAG